MKAGIVGMGTVGRAESALVSDGVQRRPARLAESLGRSASVIVG